MLCHSSSDEWMATALPVPEGTPWPHLLRMSKGRLLSPPFGRGFVAMGSDQRKAQAGLTVVASTALGQVVGCWGRGCIMVRCVS